MGKLIDGKSIAAKIKKENMEMVAMLKKNNITPKLAVILVGNDKPSQTYVNKKKEEAEEIVMDFELYKIDEKIKTEELAEKIQKIQKDNDLSGIIIQLPLPKHIDTKTILNAVRPEFDVDCLTDINQKKIEDGKNTIIPPTPGAIMEILKYLNINVKNKNIVIIGKGILVGKPLAFILKHLGALITVCDSKTPDTKEKCLKADIIITGVGKKDIVRGDMVKSNAIVIDAGNCFVDKKMYGDVNVPEVLEKASFVTPTPGGVGPITVSMLLRNTIIFAQNRNNFLPYEASS